MPDTSPALPASETTAKIPGIRAKVLLVDDREDKIMALESILGELRADLITARSGKEALRLLLQHEFAVILLDVSMPIMDGFETASLIRQRLSSEHTPIIFITAYGVSETHASRGYSLGAVDYIYAPVQPDILRAKVTVFIDIHLKAREIQRQADHIQAEAERRVAALESRLDRLLNDLNVGVFRSSLDGRLLTANPAFQRIFGLSSASDLSTINVGSLYIQTEDRSLLMNRLMSEGSVRDHHVRQRRIDGSFIWVSLSMTLVLESEATTYIDGLVEDVTMRKEAETALISKCEELARSNAELDKFAYVASHDLQEPLRMVASYSGLLAARYQGHLDAKGSLYLEHLLGGAKRMQLLVKNILDFSKIGKTGSFIEVDCEEILDKTLYGMQQAINDAHAEVKRSPMPKVKGDPVLLGQVFQNLISNGIKFRGSQTPIVSISAERGAGAWVFTVSDNGIGIDKAHQEGIFLIFHRLHSYAEYPGTGIGLAICRKAVEHHGGRIHVQSSPGAGADFIFSIPDPAS